MKKILMLMVVFNCVLVLSAQEEGKKKNTKEPEIEFETLEHNYGTLHQGDDGTCEFSFKNTGKSYLKLTNVFSSCGCTVPEWPKDSIAPKKSAVIKVKYNTQRIGTINKTITVESNAINNHVILKISGMVEAKPVDAAPENSTTPLSEPSR
ncbi:MAG: DUF1573 domain-containing protein [Bacteroidales bacterium]|jgi:hypothetical protein|nr:DUF1573 domain-containing protein [Bacteroidales bacterium]